MLNIRELQSRALVVFSLLLLPLCAFGGQRRMTAQQLPLTIGSWWRYAVTDSSAGTTDTIRVQVRSSTVLGNGTEAILLEYRTDSRIDSHYVARSGDTVTFYRSPDAGAPEFQMIFPISQGTFWTGNPPGEYRIVCVGRTSVPAKVFAHAFKLQHRPAVPNYHGGNTVWLVAGVGVVRFWHHATDTTIPATSSIEWRLLSWHIGREHATGKKR